ncbi:Glycoside hydrolase 18 protein [Aspergillus alliaceus]|uniref:chitinase n=1 Tax=Petromyces alliaceus TaxID=209559 RepID=A0A5N7CND2_PETAA|nr:glycoside hydrolase superfamily [Aspergillus alliaceus]KAB8236948.1 glycoside hydrolase superfamily [Aspergillus alliaceus]KAE8395188.1 glycoside hydrolase superfamily [Aspergillus alliaceus]KAF5862408.1 Glycoside hydrolase 18 protein [Aspergillus burnettii]
MSFSKAVSLLTLALSSFQGAQAALNLNNPNNIAVYWGQNSYGQSTGPYVQQRLSYYCRNTDTDVYQISFLTRFNGVGGAPEVNFANAGDNCTTFEGTNLLNCPQIADDIKECQSLGRTILLSIGGATYNEGGFASESAAKAGAKMIWETFGPVTNSSAKRPFGDAVVDGFDFDFEAVSNNMPAFANQLRSYYETDTSKKYYTTAAPQCPYPDAADGPMLDGTVYFDAIWVQFYNNFCGLQSFVPGSTTQNNFNFETWDTWAHKTSLNKNAKVFVGIPGNRGAAGSGYQPVDVVSQIIQYTKRFSSFGGIMIWDASQVQANSGFLSGIRSALGGSSGGGGSSSTSSTTTTSKTTSSTPSTPTTTTSTTLTKTTKPTTSPTTTTSTASPPSTTCPAAGRTCPSTGAFACNGNQFGICDNGKWVMQQCPGSLACVQSGSGVYCDFPGPAGSVPCS